MKNKTTVFKILNKDGDPVDSQHMFRKADRLFSRTSDITISVKAAMRWNYPSRPAPDDLEIVEYNLTEVSRTSLKDHLSKRKIK
jgi:hypothetical protein